MMQYGYITRKEKIIDTPGTPVTEKDPVFAHNSFGFLKYSKPNIPVTSFFYARDRKVRRNVLPVIDY